jgi:biotin carboxyl carrier protein
MMRRYTLEIRGRQFVVDVQEQGADTFDVAVGGQTYAVTLTGDEDLAEGAITPELSPSGASSAAHAAAGAFAARVSRKAAAPAAAPASAHAPGAAPRTAGATGATASLNAPMPGVIIEVSVKAGDVVERGQLVAILDAMKMHNSIRSPRAGTIAEICVAPGQAVGHGDAIVRFAEG